MTSSPKLNAAQVAIAKSLIADGKKTSAEVWARAVAPRNSMGMPDPDWLRLITEWLAAVAAEQIAEVTDSAELEIERQVMAAYPDKGVMVHVLEAGTDKVTSSRKATKAELAQARHLLRGQKRIEMGVLGLSALGPIRADVLSELNLAVAVDQDPGGLVSGIVGQVVGSDAIKAWQVKQLHHLMALEPNTPKAEIARRVAKEGKGMGYSESSLQTFMSRKPPEKKVDGRTQPKKPGTKGKVSKVPDPADPFGMARKRLTK